MSSELQLIALAVLLYLYDSTVLLYANEAVLSCGRGRVWRVSTGWSGFLIGGRRVCLLNPLTPHAVCAKLRWKLGAAAESQPAAESWSSELVQLKVAAPWVWLAAFGLFVLLPLGMFTPLGLRAILPAVAMLYGSIVTALVILRRRGLLSTLSGWKFAGLLFECVACPPFGVNLIRRIALLRKVDESLLTAGQRLLPVSDWTNLRQRCVAALDRELEGQEDGGPRKEALESQRARLKSK